MRMTGASSDGIETTRTLPNFAQVKATTSRGSFWMRAMIAICSMRKAAMMMDGTMPASSSFTAETSAAAAKMISGMLGGKIGPSVAAAMVMPAENSSR